MLHTLYIATCYMPYALILLLGVTVFPAIACFPGLIRTPLLASIIPVISILIVNIITLIFYYTGIYNHSLVSCITVIFAIIGLVRGFYYYQIQPLQWRKSDFYLLLINIILLMPMIVFNGISTFMTDDALASWNYWAMHFYYNGDFPDTMGYPPFFPLFLSYCYQLLGNPEYQGPVKALLCVFPFAIMNNLAFINKDTLQRLPAYLIIVFVGVFPGFFSVGFYKFYTTGYADPMLAATMAASVTLLLKYLTDQKEQYLGYTVLCGITAALTKQPAFLWALFSLPAVLLWQSLKQQKISLNTIGALVLLIIPVVVWLLGKGGHFYNNQGVISASLHENQITLVDILATLFTSIYTYFIKQPTLLLIFILAGIAAFRQANKAALYVTFIIPATLLWFIFGSYHIRLGLHIIVTCALLIADYGYFTEAIERRFPNYAKLNHAIALNIKKITWVMFCISFILFVIFSIREQKNKHQNMPGLIYPLNAGLTQIGKYFSTGAPFVYQHIYNNAQIKIWLPPSRYLSGIFYGHTPIVPQSGDISPQGVYADIKQYKPDYVFTAGRILAVSSANVQQLALQCPRVFTEIPLGEPIYGYRLYKVNTKLLDEPVASFCKF